MPNNLTFVVVGDVDAGEVYAQLEKYFAGYPARSLAPGYIAQEPPQQGRREVNEEFPTELTRLALAWHVPGDHPSRCAGARPAFDHSRRWPQLATLSAGARGSGSCFRDLGLFLHARRSWVARDRRDARAGASGGGGAVDPRNYRRAAAGRRHRRRAGQSEKDFARPFVRLAHHHARPGLRSRLELVRHAQPQFHS